MTELLIGDKRSGAEDGARFETFDPSTGEVIAHVARARETDIDRAVAVAVEAFESSWVDSLPSDRSQLLYTIAARIRDHGDELAELDARNVGLPMRMATADVAVAARYFEYYAGIADKLHGESIPLGPAFIDYTVLEPWGVCGIIAPFNVPLQLTARSVAPALAAGNCVVVKPAEQAPLPSLRLGEIALEAGAPAGVVNFVPGFGAEAGERLVTNPDVRHITFTGSLATGRHVLRAAAETITPVTLELGGKSPQVVFEDADLDAAVTSIAGSALLTAGQVCSAGTRVLVQRSVHDALVERLTRAADAIRVGRPIDGADMGPLVSGRQRDGVLEALELARAEGATVLAGGGPEDAGLRRGFFVRPTVLGGVTPEMRVAREEVFGPVLGVIAFEDEDDAVAIANDTEFGLVAGVWTADVGRAHRVSRRVRAGQVYVNNYGVGGGVELPFGGYRKSGIGREKGVAAMREYTQLKNVCVHID